MTLTITGKSCPYILYLGAVGCLSAPNIFPFRKMNLLKGKCFGTNFKVLILINMLFVHYFTIKTFLS